MERRIAADKELLFWESVKDSEHAADFEAYLEQFPDGTYEALARNRLARLTGKQDKKPVVQVVVTPDEPERVVSPKSPAPTPESIETALGLDRDERRRIQQGLASLGFDPGPADGLFGQRTREAIGKWQASQGVSATRHLGADASRLLMAAAETVLEPFGPDWIIAKNQQCQLWGAFDWAGDEVVTWSGACIDGKASGHGRGIFTYVDGARYEGEWRENKRHGRGILTLANENRYEGEWREGKIHGLEWAPGAGQVA